jgi:hypothetical protein
MLFSSKASDDLWDGSIVTASYLRNRRPAKGITPTPYERLTGVKPDISHMRTFGARAYVKRHDINKLEARCSPVLLIGYAATSKAYRVLLNDGRIVTSTNVVVHEGEIRLDDSGDDRQDSVDEEIPGRGDSDRVPPRAAGDEEVPGHGDSDGYPPRSSGDEEGPGSGDSDSYPPHATGDEDVSEVESALSEADDRQGNVTVEAAARRSGHARRPPGEWWSLSANIAKAKTEPSTFEEAMKSPEATAWKSAMETELTSMRELEVWSQVPRTVSIKVLPCRWVFKVKRHADGTVERHKARLVAKGFKQQSGVDFDQVWAPVSRHATVRALFSTVAHQGWEMDQVDVTTAFLYGELDDEVFMEMPPGFETPGLVCKLKRSIYGFRQAPRAWHAKLKETLKKIGLRPSMADPALWLGNDVIVLLYVDAALIASRNRETVERVKQKLSEYFKLRDLKEARTFFPLLVS